MPKLTVVVSLVIDGEEYAMDGDERRAYVEELTDYLADKESPLGHLTVNGLVPRFSIVVATTDY